MKWPFVQRSGRRLGPPMPVRGLKRPGNKGRRLSFDGGRPRSAVRDPHEIRAVDFPSPGACEFLIRRRRVAGGSAFAGVSECAAIQSSNVRQIVCNERVEEIRAVFMIPPGNEQETICCYERSGVKKKLVPFRVPCPTARRGNVFNPAVSEAATTGPGQQSASRLFEFPCTRPGPSRRRIAQSSANRIGVEIVNLGPN